MNLQNLQGSKVRLVAPDSTRDAALFVKWNRSSEYHRLLDWEAPRNFSVEKVSEWFKKTFESENPEGFLFMIQELESERIIGFVELDGIRWQDGDAWVGIGLGEQETWGKGYGTEAMQLILAYAFHKLDLHRVTLTVFEYNPRAIRSYEKAGFRVEGRERSPLHREGRRWDLIFMGILKAEWLAEKEQN